MNFFLWAGLFSLSFTWLFSLNLYTSEKTAWWLILLILGILFNVVAFLGKIVFHTLDRKFSLLIVPLLLSFLILPFPYHLGMIIAGTGILILFFCPFVPLLSALASGLMVSGVILILQSPLGYLYTDFTSYSHYIFWLDSLLYRIFSFFGLDVSYSQHTLYIRTVNNLFPFPTTWEKLSLFLLLNILVGSIPLFYLFSDLKARGRNVIKLSLSGMGYLVVRYCFMILLFLYLMTFVKYKEDVCRIDIFWDPRVTFLSFLPFIYFLCKFTPLKTRENNRLFTSEKLPFSLKDWKVLTYVSLAFFFLGWFIGFQDPGKEKKGRVLLDEKHSEWEKSTRKMDTEWYGDESGYNFYWMAEFINHYFPLSRNFEEITPKLLSRYDILILKTPTSPYSREEIRSIKDFVRKGGGLYLIGEHTNVFGTSTYLNPIAKEFGFSFRYDVIFDIERKFEQIYVPPSFLPHPVVQNMPYFAFKVSCSIQPVSSRCENVILGDGIKAQDIFYPSGNFYPPPRDWTDVPFGSFCQMVGIKVKKGRVLGFTDSTSYSNFEAFFAGKPELLLGALNWLNRENRWNWLTSIFLILAVICFSLGIKTLRKNKTGSGFYLCLVILSAFCLSGALFLCEGRSRAAYPLPKAKTSYTKVVFEQEHGDYELPLKGFTKNHDKSYEVFYQWVLRVGYYPFTGKTLREDLKEADILVIINPDKEFHPQKVNQVKEYINQGGKLLIMDGAANNHSTANQLLAPLGLNIQRERHVTLSSPYSSPLMFRPSRNNALGIQGGEALLVSQEGEPILSIKRIGNGMVAVLTFSQLFVNPNMGGSYRVEPDQQLKEVYNLEYSLLQGLVQGNLETYFQKKEIPATPAKGGKQTEIKK